ncbi:MAG: DUF1989 domain-containing protein [Candidatus Binatia bacterium]
MVEHIVIPAREGRGARLSAGQRFRCIDVEGQQCGDLFAFCTDGVREYQSAEHTRVWNNNLFPRVGQQFVTNKRRPILTFIADDTPGKHDMLIAACDPTRYELLGCAGWHPSCQENLEKVMAGFGYADIEIPQPINIFTNLPVGPDGTLSWEPALTKAGDSITLRAELDCYIVLTACSQDILPINAKNLTSLALEILD